MKFQNSFYIPFLFAVCFSSCKKKTDIAEIKPSPVEVNSPSAIIVPVTLEKSDSLYILQTSVIRTSTQFDPALSVFKTLSQYDVKVFRIQYKTTFQGKTISASGIVAIPFGNIDSLPLLSYHHGTIFADKDAPTNNKSEQFVIATLASVGYVIAAPDYIGFGASTGITHPYYISKYAASVSRDLLKATQEFLIQKKLALNGKLFLAGYSQGGNVSMAVSKSIEKDPLPGLELTATAAGAGGYNMEGIFETITSMKVYPSPNYIAYIIESYRKTYQWANPVSYYFKEPYASKIPFLLDGKTDGGEINLNLTTSFDSLIEPAFVNAVKNKIDQNFIDALKENNLDNWKPIKPMRLYHSDADEVVPYSDSEQTYKSMLALGSVSVTFVPIHGRSHAQGAVPMISDVINWFSTFN